MIVASMQVYACMVTAYLLSTRKQNSLIFCCLYLTQHADCILLSQILRTDLILYNKAWVVNLVSELCQCGGTYVLTTDRYQPQSLKFFFVSVMRVYIFQCDAIYLLGSSEVWFPCNIIRYNTWCFLGNSPQERQGMDTSIRSWDYGQKIQLCVTLTTASIALWIETLVFSQ